jgi:outer membrane protein OmpA-like peptidoglycan-associated protein
MERQDAIMHKAGAAVLLLLTLCSYFSKNANGAEAPRPPPRVVIIDDLLFNSNEWSIRPDDKPILDRLVLFMAENRQSRFCLGGHTDSEEMNAKELSSKRVDSVHEYLSTKGKERGLDIWPTRREAHGTSKPIASNATEKGRAQNRRVEIVFDPQPGKPCIK